MVAYRVTFSDLCRMADRINSKRNKTEEQKGYISINSSYGYYQVHSIVCADSSAVKELYSGTTREVHAFLQGMEAGLND
jgi:hypothetical protein